MQHLLDPSWHHQVSSVAAVLASNIALVSREAIAPTGHSAPQVHPDFFDNKDLGLTSLMSVAPLTLALTAWLPIINDWYLVVGAFIFVPSYRIASVLGSNKHKLPV
jgi:hypothetical protein